MLDVFPQFFFGSCKLWNLSVGFVIIIALVFCMRQKRDKVAARQHQVDVKEDITTCWETLRISALIFNSNLAAWLPLDI